MRIFIVTMVSAITLSTHCMMDDRVLVKTLDGKNCRLPQWKIESSRLLHRKQELQKFKEKYSGAAPANISLNTVSSEKLYLFSNILDADNIPTCFSKLRPKQRDRLLCAVGPQELDCPDIVVELVKVYFQQDFIKEHIYPHLLTMEISHLLQELIIVDNCKQKTFTNTRTENYDPCMVISDNGNYNLLPSLLTGKATFNGITAPLMDVISNESDDRWFYEKITNKSPGKDYILTPTEPIDYNNPHPEEDTKKLWARLHDKNIVLQKNIKHTNIIMGSAFSNNGKYLATSSSDGVNSELILTDLAIANDAFVGADILLTGHKGKINCIGFNNQSTVFAATSDNGIYFWDTQTGSLFKELEGPATAMWINHNDTRLAILTPCQPDSFVGLIDITDINNIFIIEIIKINNAKLKNITFTPSGDNIILTTDYEAFVFDGWSGKSIMQTSEKGTTSLDSILLMPHLPILITTHHNQFNENNVTLWDINSKQWIIHNLLNNEKQVTGIGVSADGRYIVATKLTNEMVQTELYNDNTDSSLQWIKDQPNLSQRYLLLRLYRAQKLNDTLFLNPNSHAYCILKSLSQAPCDARKMVEKYLLKK